MIFFLSFGLQETYSRYNFTHDICYGVLKPQSKHFNDSKFTALSTARTVHRINMPSPHVTDMTANGVDDYHIDMVPSPVICFQTLINESSLDQCEEIL
jgi:hypothetical protein